MALKKTSKTVISCTPDGFDKSKREKEFLKIWPQLKKFYTGESLSLFRKFSFFVYRSFGKRFLEGRTPKQRYHQLKNFFDFFMSDLIQIAGDNRPRTLAGALVRVGAPLEKSLPSEGKRIASTGIMIHAVDSPFIFENLGGYLNLAEHYVFSGIHPVMTVKRKNGKIVDILPPEEEGEKEVFIKFVIRKVVNPDVIKKLESEIRSVLSALYLTVADFPDMTEETSKLSHNLYRGCHDAEDAQETAEFLNWLVPRNFIFMGMTRFDVVKKGGAFRLKKRKKTCMGVYRQHELMDTVYHGLAEEIEERILKTLHVRSVMTLDFLSRSPSIIYHREAVDAVLVRRYDEKGEVPSSVTVLLGRFARSAMVSRACDIPFLRKKFARMLLSEKIRPNSYMHREFTSAFNHLPKKELFNIDRETLSSVLNISAMFQSDDEVHLLLRHNPDFEYMSAILIFSAKKYSVENIARIRDCLSRRFASAALYMETSQSATVTHAFLYFAAKEGISASVDTIAIVNEIRELLTSWNQLVLQKIVTKLGDHEGFALFNRYRRRLTDLYKEAVNPENGVNDLLMLERVEKTQSLHMEITRTSQSTATLRIFWDRELDLMKLIPMFRNLGIHVKEELALPLKSDAGKNLYVQLLKVEDTQENIHRLERSGKTLTDAIRLIISGDMEDCRLNHLLLLAGFDWRKVDLVRGYKNYLLQTNKSVTPGSVTATINKYPRLTALAVDYFLEKFDPVRAREKEVEKIKKAFEKGLGEITDLAEDTVLRAFFNIMENTTRTNYFKPKKYYYLSFKLGCAGIAHMPKPAPMAEIYVHSSYLEGTHLRGGKAARGGLRWSDRPDDFRSEVLGLMKTQMVKNAIIVPVGSKGGFVVKKMNFQTRQERDALFKQRYQTFIRGLLDLTDNLVKGRPKPPKDLVCYDGPDPYLVVAADKGTAAMSDSANEVAEEYGFWLGDAFASGGAFGYDHKKFGITARGAWECVKRHFRELGIDIQSKSITVAGIGDMAGDVFGNGMLLSRKIKLVAAFNHAHIFLDPSPDPEKSFAERERLFEKPRSTWMDYNAEIISTGGGVYNRSAKSISLSKNMQKLLGVNKGSISGRELVRSILKMPVDLLYCGGIGTYVRASDESDRDVGDKANDSVRVTADGLRASVIGEGANLTFTSKARIEYAVKGGRLNSDAIDNSAGVDMSDHEVNIKILLEILLSKNELKNREQRNRFFVNIGPLVAVQVLANNYLQSFGISLDLVRSSRDIEQFCDYVDYMSSSGLVERESEAIPERERMMGYSKHPGHLSRPLLAILFGYEKMRIYGELLASSVVASAFSTRYLNGYFPPVMHRSFSASINKHRLKKEIIATVISNKMVNQAGAAFVFNMERVTKRAPWEVAQAYLIVENLLQADEFRKIIYGLDNKISSGDQSEYLLLMEGVIAHVTQRLLKQKFEEIGSFNFISRYQKIVSRFKMELTKRIDSLLSLEKGNMDGMVENLKEGGIPAKLAEYIVIIPYLKDIISIAAIREERRADFVQTGFLFIMVTSSFKIDWIASLLKRYPSETAWEKRSVENMLNELETRQNRLVMKIMDSKRKGEDMEAAFRNYMAEKEAEIKNYLDTAEKIKKEKSRDLLALSVLVRMLSGFA